MDSSLNHEEKMQMKNRMRQYSAELQHQTVNGPTMIKSTHPRAELNEPGSNHLIISGENKNNSDVRSLIEQLMKSKNPKINHLSLPRVSQPVLMQTEEKIFQEVVNLLEEIEELKNHITS